MKHNLINRDISWLSFNERVLQEAANDSVPLLERLKFLSIYSSNLDEFYRVRIPALIALNQIHSRDEEGNKLDEVNTIIGRQQQLFGSLLREKILPGLRNQGIHLLYREAIPEMLKEGIREYFLTRVAAYLQRVYLSALGDFFPENNKIYLAISTEQEGMEDTVILNIPVADCGRFYTAMAGDVQYVVTLDDIIREHLEFAVPGATIKGSYSFKITRDAELDLADEFKGDIAERIEQQILVRDLGLATRMLYDAAMPQEEKQRLMAAFQLGNATIVEGGAYHNLRDLGDFPPKRPELSYDKWPAVRHPLRGASIFESIDQEDIMLHVPYHSYDTVLQFFNQAALDPYVTDIAVTLYRIAGDSVIANALMSAARNGKQVIVFVELKARFDEANNIRWAKKMKSAGVKIIYSIPGLKVHAKVALVKRKAGERASYYGIFATGNFNESTARFYTDHILMTANNELLRELELLFLFLTKRRKPEEEDLFRLEHLLIAQFNLQGGFIALVDAETALARQGLPAGITIKLNNLEEEVLIGKLYEASQAGVKIELIVRGICRLKPGVAGLSENITVRRIVDRYLEHGRIFIFHNNGAPRIYLGSADWMNRNVYRRIEVCFPLYDTGLKTQMLQLMRIQLQDNQSAVQLDEKGNNCKLPEDEGAPVRAQEAIYQLIKTTRS